MTSDRKITSLIYEFQGACEADRLLGSGLALQKAAEVNASLSDFASPSSLRYDPVTLEAMWKTMEEQEKYKPLRDKYTEMAENSGLYMQALKDNPRIEAFLQKFTDEFLDGKIKSPEQQQQEQAEFIREMMCDPDIRDPLLKIITPSDEHEEIIRLQEELLFEIKYSSGSEADLTAPAQQPPMTPPSPIKSAP